MEVIHKIGRRKTSVARVYMSKGKGAVAVLMALGALVIGVLGYLNIR